MGIHTEDIDIDDKTLESLMVAVPPNKSQLTMNGDSSVVYESPIECPNWWWCMWQWLFFGFKWEKI